MVAETKTEFLRKTLHCSFVLNSNPNNISCIETMAASKKANLNTKEAINFIFADEDCDFESNSEEEEESEESSDNDQDSSEENNNDHEIPAPVTNARRRARTRGGQRRGIRTRGGSTSFKQKGGIDKAAREAELEVKWKHEDSEPVIPPFTGTAGLKVDLPVEPNIIDFVSLFLIDEFFELISNQRNLYAEQDIASHPDERHHSRSQLRVPTSPVDIMKFLSLYLLIGIIQKPSLSKYWSTDPLSQTSVFNHLMSRNHFQMILQFIHFADNSLFDPKDPNRDCLYNVRSIVELKEKPS